MIRSFFLFAAIATLSTAASLQQLVRQQNNSVVGTFVARLAGATFGCPRNIMHEADPENGFLSHDDINMNRRACPDNFSMRVFQGNVAAARAELTSTLTIEALDAFSSSVSGLIVGIEAEGRECNPVENRTSSFARGTLVIIFSVGNSQISVRGIPYPPNRTYMVIVDPERADMAAGDCFYQRTLRPTPSPSPSASILPSPSAGSAVVSTQPSPSLAASPTDDPDMSPEMDMSPTMLPETPEADGDDGDDDDDPVCFAEDGMVELEDGAFKEMKDVVIGDRVKVANGAYSEIFMFTHKDSSRVHKFVQIDTLSGDQLSVTSGHYIYINGHVAAAGLAKVGDVLELGNGQTTTVTAVNKVKKTGLYNPQTVHGDIIVNAVRASTYTRVFEPSMAQAMMAPLRVVYRVLGWSVANFNKGADCIADILPRGQVML